MATNNPLSDKLEEDKYNFALMKPEDFEKSMNK